MKTKNPKRKDKGKQEQRNGGETVWGGIGKELKEGEASKGVRNPLGIGPCCRRQTPLFSVSLGHDKASPWTLSFFILFYFLLCPHQITPFLISLFFLFFNFLLVNPHISFFFPLFYFKFHLKHMVNLPLSFSL